MLHLVCDEFLCSYVGTVCRTTLWYHDRKRRMEEAAVLGLDHPLPPSRKHKKHKQHDCSKCHQALSGNEYLVSYVSSDS